MPGPTSGTPSATTAARGRVLIGRVWPGGNREPLDGAAVLIDASDRVVAVGPRSELDLPTDLPAIGDAGSWVGPGVVDAHVHLAFGAPAAVLAGGGTPTRDPRAPPSAAARRRA